MFSAFKLHIYAADHVVYEGDCVSLSVPISDGQIGILASHTPMVAAVVPGTLSFRVKDGAAPNLLASGHGIVRFENNDALVLLENTAAEEKR